MATNTQIKWEVHLSANGRYTYGNSDAGTMTKAEAKAEMKRLNAELDARAAQDAEIKRLNKISLESGSGIVLPTLRSFENAERRLAQYNEEPPED